MKAFIIKENFEKICIEKNLSAKDAHKMIVDACKDYSDFIQIRLGKKPVSPKIRRKIISEFNIPESDFKKYFEIK